MTGAFYERAFHLSALLFVTACGGDGGSAGAAAAGGQTGAAGSPTGPGGAPGSGGAAAGGAEVGGGAAGSGGAGAGGAPTSVPTIGAHGLSYYRYQENYDRAIASPILATQGSGSTLLVSAGRGDLSAFVPPTDNMGNSPYVALEAPHAYTNWSSSGTAVYGFTGAIGGARHVVSNANAPGDEITLAVVEVRNGSNIVDHSWVERLLGDGPITSAPVTTTGPATLVAFWWGDGGADGDKVATPSAGFQVLDGIGLEGSLVQCYVAAREVAEAGTYDVTWDATPPQGAQLWLVAVQ
jgi:hypothetical protein